MKPLLRTLCYAALLILSALVDRAQGQPVLVSDPYNLPPTGGPGWYAAPGQPVSFYVEYGTNVGMPPENTLTGILVHAHSMIVDNFRNATNWFDGNDQVIRFDANLTASVMQLGEMSADPPMTITLGGHMQVRLGGRLGQPTGVFPLTVETLSFTLFFADLGVASNTNAFLSIRTASSPLSTGQLAVASVGSGQYQVMSSLNVHSEAAMYYTDHWLPHWPDTNSPTYYELKALQLPAISLSRQVDGSTVEASLEFPTRRNVRYIFDRSPDLNSWSQAVTNFAGAGCGLGGRFNFVEPMNTVQFYRIKSELVP